VLMLLLLEFSDHQYLSGIKHPQLLSREVFKCYSIFLKEKQPAKYTV
jgi:hypothetical protein